MSITRRTTAAFLLPVFTLAPVTVHACSSCGCSVGTEWAGVGYSAAPGLRVSVRYDFIHQSDLRHGTHAASDDDVADALESGSAEEEQTATLTRFYSLGLDWGLTRDWAVNLSLPVLDRTHGTIEDGEDGISTSSKTGFGDVRVVARYQGFFEDRSLGVQFGLKLPTGSTHQAFDGGPGRGELLDRGLQLGTGTVDAIAGVYHFQAFARDWDHFEELQIKLPLHEDEGFEPGTQIVANLGVRYLGIARLVPQLQLNFKREGKESGDAADRPNSGSNELFISPGLSWNAAKAFSLYGFLQLPVWRDFRGLQLAPDSLVTVGASYSF